MDGTLQAVPPMTISSTFMAACMTHGACRSAAMREGRRGARAAGREYAPAARTAMCKTSRWCKRVSRRTERRAIAQHSTAQRSARGSCSRGGVRDDGTPQRLPVSPLSSLALLHAQLPAVGPGAGRSASQLLVSLQPHGLCAASGAAFLLGTCCAV